MLDTQINRFGEKIVTNLPDEITTKKHGGHSLRTNRAIVDRKKLDQSLPKRTKKKSSPTPIQGIPIKIPTKKNIVWMVIR